MNHSRKNPQLACVIIPVYQSSLTDYEQISLNQCLHILGKHPIILVTPQTLDVSYLTHPHPQLQVRTFDDSYFKDIQAYNRLMLSEEFYQAFTDFDYMLIHQLDAFVFQDELTDWCHRGYDYIGAPWLRDRDFIDWKDEAAFTIKKKIALWLDLKKEDGVTPREITSLNGVGNGGFSLRKVSSLLRWIRFFRKKIANYEKIHAHQYNEDIFWGVEVNRYVPLLNIPDFRTAMRFAVEFYPERAIATYNNGHLPFGCHAWDIHGTDYWRPIFATYGYSI
ncbi:hypothetical protein LX87_05095 [Larkinella arboricola]|uniref:DUF5672 domain-containing protein n=1 Tax=Larkinella arboricola TaxID=643671 RepID=A0A327WL55_LARAB|nr:DUF5672 family protein [Larkinella arboricola]RAJ92131.1 hypothetical protein LX87_05095 [Larkinella arboricola]